MQEQGDYHRPEEEIDAQPEEDFLASGCFSLFQPVP
jgi:hypothetical protein